MRTRRKRKEKTEDSQFANPEGSPPEPTAEECRGFPAVSTWTGAMSARFHEVDTAELLVIEDMEFEITREAVEGRFVKVAPRIPTSERDSFDGAAIAKVLRGYGARAVILAPVMIPEVRRVEPEQVVKRTPRETVKAWFGEQKAIDTPTRDAALELVFGFMDEEGL